MTMVNRVECIKAQYSFRVDKRSPLSYDKRGSVEFTSFLPKQGPSTVRPFDFAQDRQAHGRQGSSQAGQAAGDIRGVTSHQNPPLPPLFKGGRKKA
jgi:hypothetical protein